MNEHDSEGMGSGTKVALGVFGCLGLFVVLVVGLGAFAYIQGRSFVRDQVGPYLAEQPVTFPVPSAEPGEVDDVIKRYDDFREAAAAGEQVEALSLSAEEINLLLANHTDLEPLADKARVEIQGDLLSAEVSIPLPEEMPMVGDIVGGKYLNGIGTIAAREVNGEPGLFLEDLSVDGKVIPEEYLAEMKTENLLDQNHSKGSQGLEEIRIENGRLILKARSRTIESTPANADPSSAEKADEGLPLELEPAPAP